MGIVMRLATFLLAGGQTQAGRVVGDMVTPVVGSDVRALLENEEFSTLATGPQIPLADVDLAPVIVEPRKVFCVGHNYRSHIAEMGADVPDYPTLFSKTARSLIGARDPIRLPPESAFPDYEAELVVVIGRVVRRADEEAAQRAIAGFTVGNDVTMRDWQRRTREWLQGKTWEGSSPIGPYLVTVDEVGPEPDLLLRCAVNGSVVQESRTSDLLFTPVHLVRYISTFVTLEPGDLIFTGTPSGVGFARVPPVRLEAGDVVETTIESLGALRNECVAEA